MHLLVLGANGLLGSNVVDVAHDRGWYVTGTYHSTEPPFDISLTQLDITDTNSVEDLLKSSGPDWVVNCAAMTDVDDCEKHPEQAHNVNAHAPGKIAALCAAESIQFLHVSTDYVFDGAESGKYDENAPPNPIQEYGESKLSGERNVVEQDPEALIARLSFVYGVHQGTGELTGFPAWMRNRLVAGEETPLFIDQHVTPTRAGQAAKTFCKLIERNESGLFHVAARSCVTPYEFGVEIANRLNIDKTLLKEGSQTDVDRDADRPKRTCLDVGHVKEVLGRSQPTLQEDLDAIAGAFEEENIRVK